MRTRTANGLILLSALLAGAAPAASTMKGGKVPAYIVFTKIKTLDQKELDAYLAVVESTRKGHPQKFIVRQGAYEVLEGEPVEGISIVEFPSAAEARAWYFSDAYQQVIGHRKKGAVYTAVLVEGVP